MTAFAEKGMDGFTITTYMQTRDGRNDAMFFVGDQRHRIRRGKMTKKSRNIVKTPRKHRALIGASARGV